MRKTTATEPQWWLDYLATGPSDRLNDYWYCQQTGNTAGIDQHRALAQIYASHTLPHRALALAAENLQDTLAAMDAAVTDSYGLDDPAARAADLLALAGQAAHHHHAHKQLQAQTGVASPLYRKHQAAAETLSAAVRDRQPALDAWYEQLQADSEAAARLGVAPKPLPAGFDPQLCQRRIAARAEHQKAEANTTSRRLEVRNGEWHTVRA